MYTDRKNEREKERGISWLSPQVGMEIYQYLVHAYLGKEGKKEKGSAKLYQMSVAGKVNFKDIFSCERKPNGTK